MPRRAGSVAKRGISRLLRKCCPIESREVVPWKGKSDILFLKFHATNELTQDEGVCDENFKRGVCNCRYSTSSRSLLPRDHQPELGSGLPGYAGKTSVGSYGR